jgi:hypothetical protein
MQLDSQSLGNLLEHLQRMLVILILDEYEDLFVWVKIYFCKAGSSKRAMPPVRLDLDDFDVTQQL